MIFYSAKDIASRSCMQIKMFQEHPELKPQPTELMKLGTLFQDKVFNETENAIGQEMGSIYFIDDVGVSFSVDIVCNDKFIETKSVKDASADNTFYFNRCVFQCAIYKALLYLTKGRISTSAFYVNLGNDKKIAVVAPENDYLLRFGEETYKIDIDNVDVFLKFIKEKVNAISNWDSAKQFDLQYKYKEYDIFSKYITVTKM
jgi:hypothetical protein